MYNLSYAIKRLFLSIFNLQSSIFNLQSSILILLLVLPGIVQAEKQPATEIVKVIGTSTIYRQDVETAKKNAISDGLVSAVSQVALGLLPDKPLVSNFKEINEILQGSTDEFIQNYKVMAEAETEKIYSVMVMATISVDGLKERLSDVGIAEVKKQVVMPKILFFIAEQNIDNISPQYWWGENSEPAESVSENAIAKTMKEKGFQIVEHGNSAPEVQGAGSAVIYKPYLEGYEAVDMGVNLQADVVIVGNSVAQQSLNVGENIKSFTGTLTVRAFRTDTGEEIASSVRTAVKAGDDEIRGARDALSSSGTLAGQDLASQIAYVWNQKIKESEMVTITVGGTSNLGNFVMFRKTLSEIPGVKEIQIREMKPDEATITADFQKNIRELAEALMIRNFESFGIHLREEAQRKLRIELVPK